VLTQPTNVTKNIQRPGVEFVQLFNALQVSHVVMPEVTSVLARKMRKMETGLAIPHS